MAVCSLFFSHKESTVNIEKKLRAKPLCENQTPTNHEMETV